MKRKPTYETMQYLFLTIISFLSVPVFTQIQNDSADIVQLLRDDYHTMMTHDLTKHMQNCTEDYRLMEHGEIWNMEREAEWYKSDAVKVYDRKDYFDIKVMRVSGSLAYTVYHLKPDITENGVLTTK